MTQPKPKIKFTVQDYMSTPEGTRYQLLDGEMILAPSPTDKHQRLLANLYRAVHAFVDAGNLGRVRFAPLDVVLSDYDVAQPLVRGGDGHGRAWPERRPRFAGRCVGWCRRNVRSPGVTLARDLKSPEA